MPSTILVVDDSPTIRKVVASILDQNGYETIVAGDGQEALHKLETETPDLVLLDFVMPKMNGYQFCRELRAHARLSKLPVVLMSAKGDKIRGQFVQQTGAIDAITKPFDPKALLAVLETALQKHDTGHPPAEELEEEESDAGIDFAAIQLNEDPIRRRKQVAAVFARGLANLLGPVLEEYTGRSPDSGDGLRMLMERHLSPSKLRGLGTVLRLLDTGAADGGAALAGDLSFVSIAEVLQMLELQRQTGALSITRADASITLFLGNGAIDLAQSRGLPLSYRMGRYIVREGIATRAEIKDLLDTEQSRLLGDALVQQGKATEEQIKSVLRTQSSELIYEAVRWKEGRFMFMSHASCPEATLAQLGMAPGGILMEGFRRVDEWQLIEGTFDFDDVLTPAPGALAKLTKSSELNEEERQVFDAIDGKRTVRELLDEVNVSTFHVCKTLYQFINSRLVRRVSE